MANTVKTRTETEDRALKVVIWQPAELTLTANTQSTGRVANTTLRLNKKQFIFTPIEV